MHRRKIILRISAAKIKGLEQGSKKVSCAQLFTPSIIHASSTKKGKPMKKQEIIAAIAYPPAKEAALELAEKAEEAE